MASTVTHNHGPDPYPTRDRRSWGILADLTLRARPLSSLVRLSVITPTRNRAGLWRSGWLLNSLAVQTDPPDELVVALDHTEDDTLDAICSSTTPFPIRILEVLDPRPGPNPASATPDNCLFAAATGDILLHLDDDLRVSPGLVRRIRVLLACTARAVIWLPMLFINPDGSPITSTPPVDSRSTRAARHNWLTLPGGLTPLPRSALMHWGAGFAVHRTEIRNIGGHCRQTAALHNADTRLGNRLVRAGVQSYLGVHPDLRAEHLGPTWYATHKSDPQALRESRGPSYGITVANGGAAYWDSETCRQSYRVIKVLDSRTP